MSKLTKRIRVYTSSDVASHNKAGDCWVTRRGKVYDVSKFVDDHPGGDDLVLEYAGREIGRVMAGYTSEVEGDDVRGGHDHSEAAYEMLDEYLVGKLGTEETIVKDDWEATEDFHPEDTDTVKDFEKNSFLDLRKPLLRQVWEANFSKAYYLKQVHQPRHLTESARLFGPDFLEMFTRTEWWVVPVFWSPIAAYLFVRCIVQFSLPASPYSTLPPFTSDPSAPLRHLDDVTPAAFGKAAICFLLGNLIWTFLEYLLHRFLFHLDALLPDKPWALTLHFLLHGIHHYLPMDRLRLVMPPLLFFVLETPFTKLAHTIFPTAVANGIIAGAFTFYVFYDCFHYALHHTKLPQYLKDMKKYHLAHHYKNFDLGYGVTSKMWDYVFNTVLPV